MQRDRGKPEPGNVLGESPAEPLRVQRRAIRRCEHQIQIRPAGTDAQSLRSLPLPVLAQRGHRRNVKHHGPPPFAVFGVPNSTL